MINRDLLFTRLFRNIALIIAVGVIGLSVAGPLDAAVHCVPNTSPGGCTDSFATIQAAINASAASGDTVKVGPGTYAENLTVNKSITFLGAQAGVDARGRVVGAPNPATESIIAQPANVGLILQAGSTGTVIDGFSFSGGTRGIESQGGPIDNLQIRNNSFKTFTGNAVFLNDTGLDITVQKNSMDGSGQTGSGDVVHLDTDLFNGFQFLDNIVQNGKATGFFVDGNHNINPSVNRSPLIARNVFTANQTGANLGTRAFKNGSIEDNTFQTSGFDGLQGGIQNTTITRNLFKSNGRSGLALTSFGNLGVDRGGQFDTVTCNAFTGNVREGIFLSTSQAAGTIGTNTINSNNIFGNTAGLTYNGTEAINAENNFWGSATGPTHPSNPGGTGDSVVTTPASATNVDFVPFATAQVVCVPAVGQPSPNLTISKSANPPSVVEGSNVSFLITVTNNGVGEATGVSVTDLLPAGLTFFSSSASQGSYASGTGIWTVGTIAAFGANATLTIVATLSSGTGGSTIQNNATITASTPADSTPGDNTASASFAALAPPDMTITKSHLGNFQQGDIGDSYTIIARNSGGSPTTAAVTVTDTLPSGLTPTGPNGTVNGWSCSISLQTVTCTRSDALAATTNYPAIIVTVNVANNAGPSLTNTATVSGGGEVNGANDSSSDPTAVTQLADVRITKSVVTPQPYGAGSNVAYTITVTNNGGSAASNVVVSDVLPSGSSFVSATPSQGSCSGTTTMTCNLGGLVSSGSATIALVLTTSSTPGVVSNTATVTSTPTDPDTTNNSSTATITTIAPSLVPAISQWALLALVGILALLGALKIRA